MISNANAWVLLWLANNEGYVLSDSPLPMYVTPFRLEELVTKGLVHTSLHASGVRIYQITPSGEDALNEYQQTLEQEAQQVAEQNAEKKRAAVERGKDVRREYRIAVLGVVLGWFLSSVSPRDVWDWISNLLH